MSVVGGEKQSCNSHRWGFGGGGGECAETRGHKSLHEETTPGLTTGEAQLQVWSPRRTVNNRLLARTHAREQEKKKKEKCPRRTSVGGARSVQERDCKKEEKKTCVTVFKEAKLWMEILPVTLHNGPLKLTTCRGLLRLAALPGSTSGSPFIHTSPLHKRLAAVSPPPVAQCGR